MYLASPFPVHRQQPPLLSAVITCSRCQHQPPSAAAPYSSSTLQQQHPPPAAAPSFSSSTLLQQHPPPAAAPSFSSSNSHG
ncbi:hypothetical protein NQZ68_031054 [Dissostichus eleginoides]|nr:hypothetical protein NQZ68_031054 [Dissostichus eleginoides]